MDSIGIAVTGRQVALRSLEAFPDDLYEGLRREIDALSLELYAMVEAAAPHKTGRLRSEIHRHVYADERHITGRVSVDGSAQDAAKAGALEYGAHRATSVSAHAMRLDHVFGTMLAAPMTVMVEAYSRTPDIQEVAFERGSLDAVSGQAVERLNAVAEAAASRANA